MQKKQKCIQIINVTESVINSKNIHLKPAAEPPWSCWQRYEKKFWGTETNIINVIYSVIKSSQPDTNSIKFKQSELE